MMYFKNTILFFSIDSKLTLVEIINICNINLKCSRYLVVGFDYSISIANVHKLHSIDYPLF